MSDGNLDTEALEDDPEVTHPVLIKDMFTENKYEVREELFDPDWLTEQTGIDYGD